MSYPTVELHPYPDVAVVAVQPAGTPPVKQPHLLPWGRKPMSATQLEEVLLEQAVAARSDVVKRGEQGASPASTSSVHEGRTQSQRGGESPLTGIGHPGEGAFDAGRGIDQIDDGALHASAAGEQLGVNLRIVQAT